MQPLYKRDKYVNKKLKKKISLGLIFPFFFIRFSGLKGNLINIEFLPKYPMDFSSISFRVRYGETDQMGIVYHGNYLQYLEMGRVEWLRELGISYKSMEENGIILPVISVRLNYLKSAAYDDLISVRTRINKLPQVKIEFDYEILAENGDILVEANTVLAFMKKDSNKPMACPDFVLEKIRERYFPHST